MTSPVRDGALLTDLYEFTMLQSYFDCGMNETATFEFFVRKLPEHRNFLMAAGLEQVLDYLAGLKLDADELEGLASTGLFSDGFLASLESLRFTGSVHAMREGTVFFVDEPILQITAPMREAQLIESRVMNLLHYESIVASKAARAVLAAPGKTLVDFGLRRAHGAEAALLSARASYIAGFTGTATLLAGLRYGIPVYGTMAHSYVQAHDSESLAFEHFARSFPRNAMLLIDTYDTEAAAHKVIDVAKKLARDGVEVKGVRLDSGDLAQHAMRVRAILDRAGLRQVTIFASGNLDEYKLEALIGKGAPIDGFGIGTRMNTSADAPYADCAYKLTEYAGVPRRKRSEGKATWPGRKQVYRRHRDDGVLDGDSLALRDEAHPGVALLEPFVIDGARAASLPSLADVRAHARSQLDALPAGLRDLAHAADYPIAVTDALTALAQRIDAQTASEAHA
ncbi:nicotinate phosphoribosyltransferase [Burkholderia oklahomensis]|uniref:nicotinate phosphoribosyltransferase n=1 Tax=Burkholderia oklahomensis TaxID=342113 RepID=UPI00016A89A7|nr:nicotinate phosphoribosyltransferase [Burkholderia oklahomensis]AJX31295.1 nicotinate phosphoribosyltransferase family protein [Burkholderia oklahomensis C6786]AOI47004.1 nicotinate phosphoribosyltransferase [Burkholderia oklahomensis C6786]KUY59886.1 nicotinate phosphoribosyltransferase [Burkholderia oklahomensis C6786]MBI0360323.1 nicotinate phosphoribosyltransferase [Burkholderia oklahomensis]MDN7675212.1 nicotinate phosphoribosyltransferase [Burkholderia oklahomensis]